MNIKRLITLTVAGTFIIAGCGMEAAKTAPSPEPVMEEATEPAPEPVMEEAAEPAEEPAMEEATEPAPEVEEEAAEPETGEDP
jgi:nitrous oxide reductase accessory protein NosL